MVIVNSSDYAAPVGGYVIDRETEPGMFKAYIPEFLYKPPYGYPRKSNVLQLRKLAKTPYVHMIVRTLVQQVASTSWDVKVKEDYSEDVSEEEAGEAIKAVKSFLTNPNGNQESFNDILVQLATDILEIDTGVLVKVFNKQQRLTQIFARDSSTFLMNPDPYGYLGNRIDIIEPLNVDLVYAQPKQTNPFVIEPSTVAKERESLLRNFYNENLRHSAAFFQYGWTAGAMPVPFGKREVVWFCSNKRTDTIYGMSPVEVLGDILFTLLYGSSYSLDMYVNNNIPAGVMQMIGANWDQIDAFKQRFKDTFIKKDLFGNERTNHWQAPVSNQEVKWTPFNFTSKDMQVLESQLWYLKLAGACFGVTPSEMGFTEDSNRAVDENQSKVGLRKGVAPLIRSIQERINSQLMPEFGYEYLEFCFDDYDYDSDKKQHDLFEQEIRMGVKTPLMVAAELGVNIDELKAGKEEEERKEQEKFEREQSSNPYDKKPFNPDEKSEKAENELEEVLVTNITKKTKELVNALNNMKKGELNNVSG